MHLSEALSPLADFRSALYYGTWPLLKSIFTDPFLLFYPRILSRRFFSGVWAAFGNGMDQNGQSMKTDLITPNASGVVLEIGAGYGHTAKYLDTSKVSRFIALEPNEDMHEEIRKHGAEVGFTEKDGSLIILPHPAEDITVIRRTLETKYGITQVDTIISILTLCSVPNPKSTISNLVNDLLRSGGTFVYLEHVRNPRKDVAWWQDAWTPIWRLAFDGCEMNRPTHLWIDELHCWTAPVAGEKRMRGFEDESPTHLFLHQVGTYKRA